jgi:type IV secretory pathway TraG/TraD family ATPase VirD4
MDEIFNLLDQYPVIPIGAGAAILVAALLKRLGKRKMPPLRSPSGFLDTPLFHWSPRDPFPVRDLLRSVAIFGASGSGKTSGSGYQLAKAIAANPKIGGLILASKPEDREFWQRIFRQAGRLRELIIFNPHMPWRMNFIDFIHRNGGDTRDITEAIMVIGETLERGENHEHDPFWKQQNARMIHNAVEIISRAKGRVTAPDIQRFINTAALTPAALAAPEFKNTFHSQCMEQAFGNLHTAIEKHDYQLAADYWIKEYPAMAEKTRSSILAGVMGIAHVFNTGIVRELVSTTTNVSPIVMDHGMWILVDMPISSYGAAGAFILGGMKYLTQRHILHRQAKEDTPACVIWCDEAQKVVNSFDSAYLAECRSHRGCMVYLTQSIHAFYTRMREGGDHEADSFLTNFYHKIFHAVGDDKTAEYASSLVGKRMHLDIDTSGSAPEDVYDAIWGNPKISVSTKQGVRKILENREFMQGLRTGGPENGFIVDGIVVRSGEPFSNGEAWMRVEFNQND